MAGIEIDIETRRAVEYLVRELPRFQQDKAIREGLGDAAKVFEAYGRANYASSTIVSRTCETARSFATRVSVSRKQGGASYAVAGLKYPDGYKAHWLDLGTKPRYTEDNKYRGYLLPTYFFSRAKDEGKAEAMDAIVDGIQRAVARLNNRG